MIYRVDRMEKANAEAERIMEAIRKNRWQEVLKAVEQWPELFFGSQLDTVQGECLFLQIWEEDRWVGRECVRILLKTPELLKHVSILNYGFSSVTIRNEEYWVSGPLMGLLALAGERELMEEALKAGLDPDGWGEGGWYAGKDGLYFFENQSGCLIRKWGTGYKPQYLTYQPFGNNIATPLLIAILREDVEMVKLLIRYGATFIPDSELCQEYLKECSSWAIRDLLKEAYGGGAA